MKSILLLHAYSADNLGDGLLVFETLNLVREAFGEEVSITLLASYPESFSLPGVRLVCSQPSRLGYDHDYLRVLRNISEFDLVLAVGGGYLRGGHIKELLKCSLVHGPQLLAASRSKAPTVYLPQSIGPFRFGTRRLVNRLLRRLDLVMVRDDRTLFELEGGGQFLRHHDLALLRKESVRDFDKLEPSRTPILSVRLIRNRLPKDVNRLGRALGTFDAYVQSAVSGNDDMKSNKLLHPRSIVSTEELIVNPTQPRVIIAMRLHAALMAIQAGHYVIHLAYERKGFGAYADLGISEFVHNVNRFDFETVAAQACELLTNSGSRELYRKRIREGEPGFQRARESLVDALRTKAAQGPSIVTTRHK